MRIISKAPLPFRSLLNVQALGLGIFKKMVLEFQVLSFEVEVFYYLMNIDENFLFVNIFYVVYVFKLIERV